MSTFDKTLVSTYGNSKMAIGFLAAIVVFGIFVVGL